MCFSPEASFGASLILGTVAIQAGRWVHKNRLTDWRHMGLIVVPVAFALQQFSEGLVWLSFLNNWQVWIQQLTVYTFSFFAFVFWPAYIPLWAWRAEPNATRRHWLKLCFLMGLAVAVVLLGRILYLGVTAEIANCHILYDSDLSTVQLWLAVSVMIGYLIATVGALFLSSLTGVRTLGILIGITYFLTMLFYQRYLVSVWCFFAAIVSILTDRLVLRKI